MEAPVSDTHQHESHRRPHAPVLTTLQASTRVPEHKTEGRISVHVLSGHIKVRASGRTFSLRPGGLLALDRRVPHDIEALEERAFLLTVAWPGRR